MSTRILFLLFLGGTASYAQDAATDSIVKAAIESQSLTGDKDKGIQLIHQDNWSEAGKYFNEEIKKDESDRQAYFGRGVVHWAQNDQTEACRDWSAVLALGDTATFKLLDKNCHGKMVVGSDTILSKQYRKMFAKKAASSTPSAEEVQQYVEEMPEYPGGQQALFDYLRKNFHYPTADRKTLQGKIYIGFVISSKGKVLFPHVERGLGSGFDQEALRVVRTMPDWKPGRKNGKPVPVKYNVPISINWK